MPSLSQFIEALTQDQDKLIQIGIIKGPKAHALVHDGSSSQNLKLKRKDKEKVHAYPKKEGYSKPFNDSSGSKGGKRKQGKNCGYCNRRNYPESAYMKKQIDQMVQLLQKNNLGDFIPKATKKKSEDQSPKKENPHAVVDIHPSFDTWIVDSDASQHTENTKDILSYVIACTGPSILMGDDSPVEVTGKGRTRSWKLRERPACSSTFCESALSVSNYTLGLRKKGGVYTRLHVHF
jgi:hypothetical protein